MCVCESVRTHATHMCIYFFSFNVEKGDKINQMTYRKRNKEEGFLIFMYAYMLALHTHIFVATGIVLFHWLILIAPVATY